VAGVGERKQAEVLTSAAKAVLISILSARLKSCPDEAALREKQVPPSAALRAALRSTGSSLGYASLAGFPARIQGWRLTRKKR
jgi:hypothetical protein